MEICASTRGRIGSGEFVDVFIVHMWIFAQARPSREKRMRREENRTERRNEGGKKGLHRDSNAGPLANIT